MEKNDKKIINCEVTFKEQNGQVVNVLSLPNVSYEMSKKTAQGIDILDGDYVQDTIPHYITELHIISTDEEAKKTFQKEVKKYEKVILK